MAMLVRPVQLKKALLSIKLMLSGIEKAPFFPAGYARKAVLSLLYNTPLSEVYSLLQGETFISVRLLQPEKAQFPMSLTLSGIVMDARLVQTAKAQSPMLVTLFGIVMLVKPVQLEKRHSQRL